MDEYFLQENYQELKENFICLLLWMFNFNTNVHECPRIFMN